MLSLVGDYTYVYTYICLGYNMAIQVIESTLTYLCLKGKEILTRKLRWICLKSADGPPNIKLSIHRELGGKFTKHHSQVGLGQLNNLYRII